MNLQETLWAGEFGDSYLVRNRVDYRQRLAFWRTIVEKTGCKSALEFGCNRGHNLLALKQFGVDMVVGVDINEAAVDEAKLLGLDVIHGGPEAIDSLGHQFDLVFTCGVLIHISPIFLHSAMRSLIVASRKHVLAVEYPSDYEQEVIYRGHKSALWKRPYGEIYSELGLTMVDVGDLDERDGFDLTRYWLMTK